MINKQESTSAGARTYNNDDFWSYIEAHRNDETSRLRLAVNSVCDSGFDINSAILQIECRQKYGKKLNDTLTRFPRFYFPDSLAGEQCTSDTAASYHETMAGNFDSIVDMTAGLGIDLFHLARKAKSATGIERKPGLAEALRYNATGLKIDNLKIIDGDSTELLDMLPEGDVLFIDPARRATDGSRVFGLTDCEPDVISVLGRIARKYKRIIIKASPMLDVTRTIADLPDCTDIVVLGTTTECKELDAVITPGSENSITTIKAVTIRPDGSTIEIKFTRDEESNCSTPPTGRPKAGDFLCEPYPAVMKAGPFKLLANRYGITKAANNTHLYFSSGKIEFPGDIFRITEVIDWQSKHIKRLKNRYPRISVTTRNFGMTADALRVKLGVKDGGDKRLFAITDANDKRLMLIVEPVY